ncbi:MAG: thioredoxin family protein [Myxococcaceae bacterium]
MSTLLTVAAVLGVGFVVLMMGLQLLIAARARAMRGKPAPELSGALGKRIAGGQPALVYFHSPGCGACRPFTPKLEELSRKGGGVHVVDVSRDLGTARAFGVMATPSTIEIAAGRIVDVHVGTVPAELLARFA